MPENPERLVRDRDAEVTAIIRCRVYGLYSALVASPHEADLEQQLQDASEVLDTQPYGIDLDALAGAYLKYPRAQRKLEYSQLFEVGDQGPPIAVREQQQFSDLAGVRENLLRFYDFFGYTLHDRSAWAPDHLSVLLEFCGLLCYRESTVAEDRLSFQLAQSDFVSRHLLHWVPVLAERTGIVASNSIYSEVALSLNDFVTQDYAWQASTIVTTDKSDDHE